MATGQETLDRDILPRVFSSLDSVFPEFGWKRARGGWVATNGRFTRERLGARPERVVARMQAGFLVYGDRSYHWLEYLAGGVFPRGPEWWSVIGQLGARVGVQLAPAGSVSPRAKALEVIVDALQGGEAVERYLAARGTAVPAAWFGLLPAEPVDLLERAGFSKEEVAASRIVRDTRWRGRVCSPWKDELGRLSSLWGRAVVDDDPKYLVLAGGSPAFFGADVAVAAARRSKAAHGVVVVEGMFDALALRSAGLDEAAAVGRAGLSAEALKALETVGEATLVLDSDSAGKAGTVRALEEWARNLSPVRLSVAHLGFDVKDPDDLLRRRGADAFRELLAQRQPAASAYVAAFLDDANTDADVLGVARRVLPFLSSVAVCHPLEAAMATELLTRRGLSASTLRLLTKQAEPDALLQMREALTRRLADVDARLGELNGGGA